MKRKEERRGRGGWEVSRERGREGRTEGGRDGGSDGGEDGVIEGGGGRKGRR